MYLDMLVNPFIFAFTQRRVYRGGDHELPEFPSHFQVAKYSVFEMVSECVIVCHVI